MVFGWQGGGEGHRPVLNLAWWLPFPWTRKMPYRDPFFVDIFPGLIRTSPGDPSCIYNVYPNWVMLELMTL
jgi:hypothetical protein